jgi:glutamine synthetase
LSISQKGNEDAFLAGLLEVWKSLVAFFMPNYDSNVRVLLGEWINWSLQNKTAKIRKVTSGHWELRGIDGTANPHLTMPAILTAGLLGISKDKELTIKDYKKMSFFRFDEKGAEEFGLKDKMHEELNEALGPEIIERYLKLREKRKITLAT